VEKPQGHWCRRFLRRIFTTAPSGAKLTPSMTTPSMAMMRLDAVVARMQSLLFRLFDRFRNFENYVGGI
jgi:hypothetical protein